MSFIVVVTDGVDAKIEAEYTDRCTVICPTDWTYHRIFEKSHNLANQVFRFLTQCGMSTSKAGRLTDLMLTGGPKE